jgi:hypothetical protein
VIGLCRPSDPAVNAPSAGDCLIEAIANAVALKLERMAGMQQRLMKVKDAVTKSGTTSKSA